MLSVWLRDVIDGVKTGWMEKSVCKQYDPMYNKNNGRR